MNRMGENSKKNEPRIVVVASTVFSNTKNNGKTAASLFSVFKTENIYEVFFSNEPIEKLPYCNYYRITDKDMVKSVIWGKEAGYADIYKDDRCSENSETNATNLINWAKQYELSRIFRELIWKLGKWNTKKLNLWLDECRPNVVALLLADSAFACDIAEYIKKRYDTKLIVFMGDDYIAPRKNVSMFWRLRRKLLLRKTKHILNISDKLFTISVPMQKEYYKLLGEKSVAMPFNIAEDNTCLDGTSIDTDKNDVIQLIYAGGLHHNRYKTLQTIGLAIKRYNENNSRKAFLSIYSQGNIDSKIIKQLNIYNACKFSGSLNRKELKSALCKSNVLVFVESFDEKNIAAVKYSFSTKITEYLSYAKPILAIGPDEVAAIQYLKDCAFCITDENHIGNKVQSFLKDEDLQRNLSMIAKKKYQENLDPQIIRSQFHDIVCGVLRSNL